ncbi:MAG: 50S ribosomal protein L3 [Acidobacteria bacterium]|nr:50S ribosomal protein L3 [Acidobacteriota bacterium]
MVEGLIGKKIGMTQIFQGDGRVVPVTVIQLGPCVVVQKKSLERDGYEAIQVGLVEGRPPKKVTRPVKGHFLRAQVVPTRILREFKPTISLEEIQVGQEIKADGVFQINEKVDVTGKSKGKGFQGVMKRHNFGGGGSTHGSMFHRAPGSIGASAYPSRVIKGMRMAGHMGDAGVTVKNLEVVRILPEKNIVLLKGAVPGYNGSYVFVKKK